MLSEGELARRIGTQIEVRPTGLRVRWDLSDMVTSDGHSVRAIFSCTAQALDQPIERKMLEETLLASRIGITAGDVAAHFSPTLRARTTDICRAMTVDSLLGDAGRKTLREALENAGKSAAFSCGIDLLGPFDLSLDCPTLNQQQAAKRRASEQAEGLQRAGDIFKQFQNIRASAPELSAAAVLDRLGVADQADLLKSILLATSGQTPSANLWVVSGNSLVKISSASPSITPIPQTLGPLRSVQDDGSGNLLLGCRGGVIRWNSQSPAAATMFAAPAISSQLGFNAAILHNDRIWASHGEAGLVVWRLDQTESPEKILKPNQNGFAPGNLIAIDSSSLLCSAGGQLYRVDGEGELQPLGAPAAGNIIAIVKQNNKIVTLHDSGTICLRDQQTGAVESQRRVASLTAASATPWLGDQRLLLATEDGPILCAGAEDDLITQFTSPHRACRIVAGASHAIAAVSSDRQRLILWHAWDGRKPSSEIHIASLTQHRVADIAFVPATI